MILQYHKTLSMMLWQQKIATTHAGTIYIQVNKKFCELKGGNIGIVEKAQETRFGMSPKYSRYIGI